LKKQTDSKQLISRIGKSWLVNLGIFISLTLLIVLIAFWADNQQLNENSISRLNLTLNYLDNWLGNQNIGNKIASEGLASQRNVVAALIQHEQGKPELDRVLAGGLRRKLYVNFIAFIDKEGKTIASDPPDLPANWLPQTIVKAALSGNPLPPGAEQGGNNLLLVASSSVLSENQPIGAVILGDLLNDSESTIVDAKKALGLDIAIVVNGQLKSSTLASNTGNSILSADIATIESKLKTTNQLISDTSLNGQSYLAGYKAIISDRRLIGEWVVLQSREEIDRAWFSFFWPVTATLVCSWIIMTFLLSLFYGYQRQLISQVTDSVPPDTFSSSKYPESNQLASPVGKEETIDSAPLLVSTSNLLTTNYAEEANLPVFINSASIEREEPAQNGSLPLQKESLTPELEDWEYYGNLVLNRAAYEAKLNGQFLSMTRIEFELLCALVSKSQKVVSRNDLINLVWGEDYLAEPGTVDAHISNLRRKIEPDPSRPTIIVTVRGVGYKFQPPG